jgi:hypothetical protein
MLMLEMSKFAARMKPTRTLAVSITSPLLSANENGDFYKRCIWQKAGSKTCAVRPITPLQI